MMRMKMYDALRTMLLSRKEQESHQLYTSWGEELNVNEVWKEYPRPQMVRKDYTILNGSWDYKFSDSDMIPEEYQGTILVPFSPEAVLSGVDRQLRPGEYLWYHRTLRIEKIPVKRRLILHFQAVDQSCQVYINHKKVCEHHGGYLPFSVDITEKIHVGINHIEAKVQDPSDTTYHSRGKQKLKRGGMFYTAQSGIWQTVWMEWVPELYITDVHITPCYDSNEVRFEIKMNREMDTRFQVEIFANHHKAAEKESCSRAMVLKIENRISWSPVNPFLYQVVIRAGEDQVESYFAMRKIAVVTGKDGIPRIQLNNEPYFQNGVLDQGYWPDGLYTAPCDEAMIYDIQTMKDLGYNMIRKHIKIEPLRWYYHCDRLGMLVWQDMVNGGEEYSSLYVTYLPTISKKAVQMSDRKYRKTSRKNKKGREEWMKECKDTVNHLYNCPCIVTWVPFNEGWGQFDAKEAVTVIRTIDKTRLIDHASGWFDQGAGDMKSVHNYFRKLTVDLDERAYVISEYGGYACYVEHHSFSSQIYGYRKYDTVEELTVEYKRLMEEEVHFLIEKGLSAAVYTQLSDVEDEVNGLMTYDRKVIKVPPVNI